jgi:trehalose 6-phosphate synthase/phosphatase
MRKKLIIASNRLPFKIEKRNGAYEISISSGGLVSALKSFIESYTKEYEIVWVGCPEFNLDTWRENQHAFHKNDFQIHPVFVHNRKEKTLYYNGFSNSTIWPLFHYFPSFAEFKEEQYAAYKKVNRIFAEEILKIAKQDDVIWIHDYHLMLLPAMIKQHLPDAQTGFFLHIPFPSHEIYKLLPQGWREELLNSLIRSDLIGFQTKEYVNHFLFTLSYFLGIEHTQGKIFHNGHFCNVADYPISINFNKFFDAYNALSVSKGRKALTEKYRNTQLIFSVDRLDYTKGIVNRLAAFEKLLEEHPGYKEKIVFIMNVVPSRDAISKYSQRKKMIEENIGRINGKYGNTDWQPIIYQYRHLSFSQLLTFYTSCHVALVTPLRDGMNLVAKEFVASRADRKGVLILSEMTGAANELEMAIIVNPTDINKLKESLVKALEMPIKEQARRMMLMQEMVSENNVDHWLKNFMKALDSIQVENKQLHTNVLSFEAKNTLFKQYKEATKRLLLLDYDGTLTDYALLPEQAFPSDHLISLIKMLSEIRNNKVCIISGRRAEELEKWFGHLKVILVAEHGCTYKLPYEKSWLQMANLDLTWKGRVKEVLQKLVITYPGSFIEDKIYSLAWHYRAVQSAIDDQLFIDTNKKLSAINVGNSFKVLQGNKVLEMKSSNMNKGLATMKLLSSDSFDFVMAIGDDSTDEDMFEVLQDTSHVTIKVGLDKSKAQFNLIGITNVISFLDQLAFLN